MPENPSECHPCYKEGLFKAVVERVRLARKRVPLAPFGIRPPNDDDARRQGADREPVAGLVVKG